MPTSIRIATFNVENLFDRAKLLNLDDHSAGDQLVEKVGELQAELKKATYDKPRLLSLYRALQDYVTVIETREKLFKRKGFKITGVAADGREDWEGWIEFKRDKFPDAARSNTAKVIRTVNADITCLVEVENRPLIEKFARNKLTGQYGYAHNMLVDGNDQRGIDVGVLSRNPITRLRSHIDDRDGNRPIFSRDCLEVEIQLPNQQRLSILLNHFKSKGYGAAAKNDARRKRQAERVRDILTTTYNLQTDWVVVAGDLNDTPNRPPLQPLLSVPNLHDVLVLKFPNPADRWTYHYKKNEQIDYILVSEPLRQAWQDAGVERRGIYEVKKFTSGAVQPFPTVTSYKSSASDHGAVWAEFVI